MRITDENRPLLRIIKRDGTSDEIVAGAQSRKVYQQFTADPKAVQAMMLTRLPQRA